MQSFLPTAAFLEDLQYHSSAENGAGASQAITSTQRYDSGANTPSVGPHRSIKLPCATIRWLRCAASSPTAPADAPWHLHLPGALLPISTDLHAARPNLQQTNMQQHPAAAGQSVTGWRALWAPPDTAAAHAGGYCCLKKCRLATGFCLVARLLR